LPSIAAYSHSPEFYPFDGGNGRTLPFEPGTPGSITLVGGHEVSVVFIDGHESSATCIVQSAILTFIDFIVLLLVFSYFYENFISPVYTISYIKNNIIKYM